MPIRFACRAEELIERTEHAVDTIWEERSRRNLCHFPDRAATSQTVGSFCNDFT
jgi:hypothetical protein